MSDGSSDGLARVTVVAAGAIEAAAGTLTGRVAAGLGFEVLKPGSWLQIVNSVGEVALVAVGAGVSERPVGAELRLVEGLFFLRVFFVNVLFRYGPSSGGLSWGTGCLVRAPPVVPASPEVGFVPEIVEARVVKRPKLLSHVGVHVVCALAAFS